MSSGGLGLGLGLGIGRGGVGEWRATSIPGCVLWRVADQGYTLVSGRVSAWNDLVGDDANKHALQANPARQPLWNASDANLGGKPSMTFATARADRLVSGTWSTPCPNPATWFAFGYLTSRPGGGFSFVTDGIGASSRQALGTSNTSNNMLAFSGSSLAGGTLASGAFALCGVTSSSGKLYLNARTAVASGTTGTQTLLGVCHGTDASDTGPGTYAFNGALAEVIGYNRALSQAEIESVLIVRGSRYAIPIAA